MKLIFIFGFIVLLGVALAGVEGRKDVPGTEEGEDPVVVVQKLRKAQQVLKRAEMKVHHEFIEDGNSKLRVQRKVKPKFFLNAIVSILGALFGKS